MSNLPDFDALWDFGDPAGTESTFRKLLEDHPTASPPSWRAEVSTQIARTLGLQRRFEEADLVLDDVRTVAEEDPRVMARWLLEKGRVRNSSGRKAEAFPLFEEAWKYAEKAGADYFAVDALHMLAIAASPDDQMEWHRRAIDRAANSTEEKARNWRASLLNNLAWTLHGSGQFEEALRKFEEALAARIEQGKEGPIRIARWSVARCLRSLGRLEEALAQQQALALDHAGAATSDGYVEEELGECLLSLGRKEEAIPHFGRAHELLSEDEWLAKNEPARLARLKELAMI